MLKYFAHIVLLFILVAASSCSGNSCDVENPMPSVYYWRTVFKLDSTESHFLQQHNVGRMYVRYFDVVVNGDDVKPNATIKFAQPVPSGIEVVPAVFIMNNCFTHNTDGLANKIVDRVLQMNETHDVAGVKELQIDCDWTTSTQGKYYAFLSEVKTLLQQHGMRLSATIRLHQLTLDAPPVDYGVLMMYNTGALNPKSDRNPILDYRDAYPYLKHLGKYKLPLCAAWPCYKWNLLYHGDEFKAILYDVDLNDTTAYRTVAPGRHVVVSNRPLPEPNSNGSDLTWIDAGDSVITVMPTASQIMHIVEATEKERPGINKQAIIYSLDKTNINNYDNEFFKTIFSR